ncbi:MAG: hypothetical protein KGH75_13810 [Rhodospirillales bacterium]|nr:hypothetical protein [Rhodospirillales bacterium]
MDSALLTTAPRDQGLETEMFTMQNTSGYDHDQLDHLNQALRDALEVFAEENPEFACGGDEYAEFEQATMERLQRDFDTKLAVEAREVRESGI